MYYKISSVIIGILTIVTLSYGQVEIITPEERKKIFIAYEFGEAAFNKMQSLSGEVGIRFSNQQSLRLTHMNVNLTEKHLRSSFAAAVDGSSVKSKLFGFELFYNFPIFTKGLSIGPSVGYYKNEYEHTIIDKHIEQKSTTIGLGISYKESNVFHIDGLYYRFSIPIRTHFNPSDKTVIGDSTVNKNTIDNNIWLFVGYEF